LGSVFNSSVFGGRIDGGEGTLTLRGGTLDLSELDIFSQGPLEITGSGAVTLGDLRNPGRSITVSGSAITAGTLNTRSPRGSSLEGGAISLTAGTTAETGDLLTNGSSGGDVTVQATTSITTGRIDTSGRGGDGGDLLLDPEDDIEVVSINAQGGPAGTGGDIEITTETFFRATGDFIDRSSVRTSISASGGDGGGDITITHGGDDTTPFTIGVDGELENGTAAAIVSNGDQLGAPQSFLGDRVEGNIRIETGDPPAPPVSPGPPDPPELPEGPCPPDCDPVLQPLSTTRAEPGSQRPLVTEASTSLADIASAVTELEDQVTAEFSAHLGLDQTPAPISLGSIIATLQDVQKEAGITPAILYATFSEQTSAMAEDSTEATGIETAASLGNRRLELILITADARPVHIQVPEATQAQVQTAAARLRRQVSIPSRVGTTAYQASAQQLHRWLIDPIEATLAAQGIDTLGIVTDAGLRSLPFAALYNGDSFLVERYALTLVPSLTLTYLEYQNLQQSDALLGGTSSFANQAPLPFVPLELNRIQALWDGERFQGENFTRKALREQVQQDYDIIHLATHGEFQPGNISNSYIQFSDGRLAVDALQQLEWQPENIRLVTLSACQTALGNREAELGFAGLAVSAGAQTALASLWSVSDAATTGLMTNFYENLRTQSTKANALRDAQRAMIAGDLSLSSTLAAELDNLPLSVDINLSEDDVSFRHPYYWSAFTLVGSPW
ncbi:MAG: CHAT domain-containing protein, partial [Cyanobacteria bacterium P01_A01_bin.135]